MRRSLIDLRNALKRSNQKETPQFEESKAVISKDGKYRYALWRIWDSNLPNVMFIMLNPSTADSIKNDPTISKCIYYAKKWGYGGIYVGNLFAFRSHTPGLMMLDSDPIGPDCDDYLSWMRDRSELIIAAWGNHGSHLNRGSIIKRKFKNLYCLDLTNSGQPKHPLYLSNKLIPKHYGTF